MINEGIYAKPNRTKKMGGFHNAMREKNIKKRYTQINGEIQLCQKRNQQFNWHGDFVFIPKQVDEKYYLSDKV